MGAKKASIKTGTYIGGKEVKARAEEKSTNAASPNPKDAEVKSEMRTGLLRVTVGVPDAHPWLKVTSKKTNHFVFLPLPIRMIQQIPDAEGGGCVVRGAHGDESTAKESILEVLDMLGGYPLRSASVWSIAT